MRPISECSGSATNTYDAEVAGPSLASKVRPAQDLPTAHPPSVWETPNTHRKRISTHSQTLCETEFTDNSTDTDSKTVPALLPATESPADVRLPRSPPRAKLTRRCSITQLPPANAGLRLLGMIGVERGDADRKGRRVALIVEAWKDRMEGGGEC